jgi:hypothetical protein
MLTRSHSSLFVGLTVWLMWQLVLPLLMLELHRLGTGSSGFAPRRRGRKETRRWNPCVKLRGDARVLLLISAALRIARPPVEGHNAARNREHVAVLLGHILGGATRESRRDGRRRR